MEIFEYVSPCSGFHLDSVGSLPVGCEFPLFRVFLVSPEDEVAYFEFPPYDLFVVASGYFCFSVVSRKAALLLTSSTNSSYSRRFAVLAGKSVLASVHQVSSVNSMGMTASVPYVSRKGDSPVVE